MQQPNTKDNSKENYPHLLFNSTPILEQLSSTSLISQTSLSNPDFLDYSLLNESEQCQWDTFLTSIVEPNDLFSPLKQFSPLLQDASQPLFTNNIASFVPCYQPMTFHKPLVCSKQDKKNLLSEEDKRINHIASEKKRRLMIKAGFDGLTEVMPNLRNNAKNVILMGAVDLIQKLEREAGEIELEIKAIKEKMSSRAAG